MDNGPSKETVDLANQLVSAYDALDEKGKKIADHWGMGANLSAAMSDEVSKMNDSIRDGYLQNAKLSKDLMNADSLRGTKYYDQAMSNLNLDQELQTTVKDRAKAEIALIEARRTGVASAIAEAEESIKVLDAREGQLNTAIETKKQDDLIKAKKEEMLKPMKDMQDKWTDIKANASAFVQTIMTGPGLMAVLTAGALALGAAMLQAFMATEASIQKIYDTTGLSVSQVGHMRDQANSLRTEFADMGMGFDEIVATQQAFIGEFGNMIGMTKTMTEDLGMMQYQWGLSAENSAKVMNTMMGITDGSAASAKNMMMMVNSAAGDNYADAGQVMQDIANLSGEALAYFSGNPKQLAEAAAYARGLGIEISKMVGAADAMLNLESSLTNEMEAEMLIGRNLNLDKMRQAAFTGDMVTMGKEILKNTGGLANFNSMNVVQQKAMAKAMGMSVGDLRTMLTTEERMKNLTMEQRKELEAIGASQKEQKEMTFEEMKAAKEREVATQKFKNEMQKLIASLQETFLPIIESVAGFLADWAGTLGIILKVLGAIVGVMYILKGIGLARMAYQKVMEAGGIREVARAKMKALLGGGDAEGSGPTGDKTKAATKSKKKGFKPPMMKMSMSQALKGAAAMLIVAAALWVMAKALQEFNTVEWGSVAKGAVGLILLAGVVFLLSMVAGNMIVGSIAMLIMAGALWVLGQALLLFNEINWDSIIMAGVALVGLAAVAALLGMMIIPLMLGSIGIAILSAALMTFVAPATLIAAAAPGVLSLLEGLMEMDGKILEGAGFGIGVIGRALYEFGLGSMFAAVAALIWDPVNQFKRFAEIGPDLRIAAQAIQEIAASVNLFSEIKAESDMLVVAAKNIGLYAGALMAASGAQTAFAATALLATPFMGIMALASGFLGGSANEPDAPQQVEVVSDASNTELMAKLDEVKSALAGVEVKIDGKRAGELIFSATPNNTVVG